MYPVKQNKLAQVTETYRQDAVRLKENLRQQNINEPVSVLYKRYPNGDIICTVRIGRHFVDSGYWFVAETL